MTVAETHSAPDRGTPSREYTVISELHGRTARLSGFRPTLVEPFGPGRWPTIGRWRTRTVPLFAVGRFEPDGATLVGVTTLREELRPCSVPTFFTVDAWAASRLSFDRPDGVEAFMLSLEVALQSAVFWPRQHILVGNPCEHVPLQAEYGPAPWGRDGCLVISARGEPDWVMHQFPLGEVVLEQTRFLYPEEVLAPLGRHVGGDSGEGSEFLGATQGATCEGQVIESYYVLPGVAPRTVRVSTNARRTETRVVSVD